MIKKYRAQINESHNGCSQTHEIEVQLDNMEAFRINNSPRGDAAKAYGKMFFPTADKINHVFLQEMRD